MASAQDGYEEDDQMTKKEVNDYRSGGERRRNTISNWTTSILIPYSNARSINIQLHQDRVALSILFPFLHSLPANTHSRTYPLGRSRRVGRRKRGGRRQNACTGGRALYAKSAKVYNNVCAPAFQIDSNGHWSLILKRERMFTYISCCRDVLHPRSLPSSMNFHQPLSEHFRFDREIFLSWKRQFLFLCLVRIVFFMYVHR